MTIFGGAQKENGYIEKRFLKGTTLQNKMFHQRDISKPTKPLEMKKKKTYHPSNDI